MRLHRPLLFVAALTLVAASIIGPALAGNEDERAGYTAIVDHLEWALATSGENIKWPEAVEYCAELELAGHSDWRLPTLDELARLHDPDADGEYEIRSPFVIDDCCLWSGESLVDRPAEDGDGIGGQPEMYHWGFMFDGGLPYYAVHIFDDGQALCARDVGTSTEP